MLTEQHGITKRMLKLVSSKGTLLGTITIPVEWYDMLREDRKVAFYIALNRTAPPLGDYNGPMLDFSYAVIVESMWMDDAVELQGVTIEAFEQVPGCTFAPSAAYLRSIVEGS
jgi:hypothetical protein